MAGIRSWLAAGGALGAVLWLLTWEMSHRVDLGADRGVGGLSEGQIRAFLNPALILLLPLPGLLRAAQGGRDGRLGRAGAWLAAAGLFLQLLGNVLEYGWWGNRLSDAGWGVFLMGFLPLSAGWLLLGVAALRARILPAWLAAVPLLLALLLPGSMATGLASSNLGERQPALERFFAGTGLGWLALALGLLAAARRPSRSSTDPPTATSPE